MGLSDDEIRNLYDSHKSRWQRLDEWLDETEPKQITNADVAKAMDVSPPVATRYIQAHLDVSRRPDSPTLFQLKRKGRTRTTVWQVHNRLAGQVIDRTLYEDFRTRILRAYVPDMAKLAEVNPRVRRRCERRIDYAIHNVVGAVAVLVDDALDEGEE